MKKFLTLALVAMVALSASAAKKKAPEKNANKPVFTIIKENPITTIKDQNRSGTCWDYSTLSFFEVPSRWFAITATVSLHRAEVPRMCFRH